eukprot:UN15010
MLLRLLFAKNQFMLLSFPFQRIKFMFQLNYLST